MIERLCGKCQDRGVCQSKEWIREVSDRSNSFTPEGTKNAIEYIKERSTPPDCPVIYPKAEEAQSIRPLSSEPAT